MSSENKQIELLTEILKWIKVSSYQKVKDFLNFILDTDTKKVIYQLSDGDTGSTEIIKKAKASSATVSKCWQDWEKLGIGEALSSAGGKRFKRTFDLEDFGLLPKLIQSTKEKKNE